MTLDLKLTIDRTDLRYQEDVACRLTLANRGSAPLSAPPRLGYNPALLRLRTIDVKTGAETVHAPPPNPLEEFDPADERPLKAGESLSAVVSLLYLPKVLLPGE